jgi:hypothetical protein
MSANIAQRSTERPHDQPVLSIRASVPESEAGEFVAGALHDIRVYLQEHHERPAGPPFSIRWPAGRAMDIEAGLPTEARLPGSGRIHGGALPRSLLEPETGWNLPD